MVVGGEVSDYRRGLSAFVVEDAAGICLFL